MMKIVVYAILVQNHEEMKKIDCERMELNEKKSERSCFLRIKIVVHVILVRNHEKIDFEGNERMEWDEKKVKGIQKGNAFSD